MNQLEKVHSKVWLLCPISYQANTDLSTNPSNPTPPSHWLTDCQSNSILAGQVRWHLAWPWIILIFCILWYFSNLVGILALIPIPNSTFLLPISGSFGNVEGDSSLTGQNGILGFSNFTFSPSLSHGHCPGHCNHSGQNPNLSDALIERVLWV